MGKNDVKVLNIRVLLVIRKVKGDYGWFNKSQKCLVMVNGHLGWSKVICVGQRSLGLNDVDFDNLVAVIRKKTNIKVVVRKSPKFEGCYSQITLFFFIKL